MYFFTHLFISKVLYQHFAGAVELNERAFAYGNIKPDLPSKQHNHHTLENYLFTVCAMTNQLMCDEMPEEDFSVQLGEVCHYVSDFFCYYHVNEDIHNRKLRHFFYELSLHHKLLHMNSKQKFKVFPSRMKPRKDISSIILEMRKNYFSQPKDMKRDIEYAFSTAVWICESIIYFLKYSSDLMEESAAEFYSLPAKKGGSL